MGNQYTLPPDPQHAILKRIYPWEEYNLTMIMQWLYEQAKRTGFIGTYEEFKEKYGLINHKADSYTGQYEVVPQAYVDQILRTANKILEEDIIITQIPYTETSNTAGGTTVIIG